MRIDVVGSYKMKMTNVFLHVMVCKATDVSELKFKFGCVDAFRGKKLQINVWAKTKGLTSPAMSFKFVEYNLP